MPPTFLIFLGFIIYIILCAVSLIIFVPMYLKDSNKVMAQKALATVFISLPCLLIIGLFWVILFIIPALIFFWITNSGFLPQILVIIFSLSGLAIFGLLVAISALYFWFFTSKIICAKIDKEPIILVVENDVVFKFIKPYLIRFKIYKLK